MSKLTSPQGIREVMEAFDFRFSKGLGQNFLISDTVLDEIVEGSEITKDDYVLEIGPGFGTLTQALCESAGKVVSVEIDKRLREVLYCTLQGYDNFTLIEGDILKIDLHELVKREFEGKKIKVAANLPYYITSPIVMMFLESGIDLDKVTVMVQKEVAERMQAKPGTKAYGALSVAVQYYSNPKIVSIVGKELFMPAPKVDSAVICLDLYDEKPVKVKDETLFFAVVKAAFGMRRKTLLNALAGGMSLGKDLVRQALENADIDAKRRGETLSLLEFANLADAFWATKNS